MAEYRILRLCSCYGCESRRVKQKITNYEWELYIKNQTIQTEKNKYQLIQNKMS
jgi:hypothetical protein